MPIRHDQAAAELPLFVYGTLRRGFAHPMARLLARRARYLGPAKVAGRLYHLGDYPGVVCASHDNEWVYGDLYDLSAAAALLTRLDRYEGLAHGRKGQGEYRRQAVSAILLKDHSPLVVSIYLYNRSAHRKRHLCTGDYWRQWRRPPPR